MSEWQVEAYYVERETVARTFGSKDAALLQRVLADDDGLLASLGGRFSGMPLADAVTDLVNGDTARAAQYPFHYAFGTWIIVAATHDGRPSKPTLPPPGIVLYDFNAMLEDAGRYPGLLQVFRALNGEEANGFPNALPAWGDLPGFAYVERARLPALQAEIAALRRELDDGDGAFAELEDPDDVAHVLGWLEEADRRGASLCLVMDGSL